MRFEPILVTLSSIVASCAGPRADAPASSAPTAPPGASSAAPPQGPVTFADDVAYLEKHGTVLILEAPGGGRVAVSPGYQGRVMTSAVSDDGASLGWIHRPFVAAGKTGTAFDNYGGEDRFWLGPEGGQLGLYFPPGAPYTFDAWQTPHELQEGAWPVAERGPTNVALTRTMKVKSHAGTELIVDVRRDVRTLAADEVARRLSVVPSPRVRAVAFASTNRITNAGKAPWTRDRGQPSVWILGMFAPAADARVVVPFDPRGSGPVVRDDYFGKVPSDRLAVDEARGALVFKCDGQHRGKIGVGPARARPVAGSYSAASHLLTIVQYDKPTAPGARYVNSTWEQQKDPYDGDVVNSYNDGPIGPGQPSLGGFYEIETSSPAADLAPGASLTHTHRTFHFVGAPEELDPIARAVLGLSLADIAKAL